MIADEQIRIVRALQEGLPLVEEPYRESAVRAGVSQDDLLEQIRAWKADGTIRRFGAILWHHRAGYSVNAMGVWNVPDDKVEDFGRRAAQSRTVSHCYQRPRFDGFKYNVYTMMHGKSREDCEEAARKISEQTGMTDYALLYTTAEFKKSSPVYFADL
jgi:DNA-binding Lrp family transcriptional regulator